MTRHLMARFRHLAAQPVNWQRGMVLPETAFAMDDYNRTKDKLGFGPRRPWKPKHVSTALVQHADKLHALQVNHEIEIVGEPYLWSIHVHDGSDDPKEGGWEHLDPGDHDHECDMCEAPPGEQCRAGCWDQNSFTGGGMRNTHEDTEWQDGSRGELWGWQPDRESAQRAAETAWELRKQKMNAKRDQALNDALDEVGGPSRQPPPDDDHGLGSGHDGSFFL